MKVEKLVYLRVKITGTDSVMKSRMIRDIFDLKVKKRYIGELKETKSQWCNLRAVTAKLQFDPAFKRLKELSEK